MNLTCSTFLLCAWLLSHHVYIHTAQCSTLCRFALIIQIDVSSRKLKDVCIDLLTLLQQRNLWPRPALRPGPHGPSPREERGLNVAAFCFREARGDSGTLEQDSQPSPGAPGGPGVLLGECGAGPSPSSWHAGPSLPPRSGPPAPRVMDRHCSRQPPQGPRSCSSHPSSTDHPSQPTRQGPGQVPAGLAPVVDPGAAAARPSGSDFLWVKPLSGSVFILEPPCGFPREPALSSHWGEPRGRLPPLNSHGPFPASTERPEPGHWPESSLGNRAADARPCLALGWMAASRQPS